MKSTSNSPSIRNNSAAISSSAMAGWEYCHLSLSNLRRLRLISLILAGLMAVSCCVPVSCLAQADQSSKPKLVLMIVADAFPYSYLSRYQDKFQSGGFKYLLENGASFTSCKLDCASTQRDCGTSLISTGAYPWLSGVVADKWYHRGRKAATGATYDNTARLVGANGEAGSARLLRGTTIGDQMKLATNGRSKVFSIAVDQEPALLLAGKLANNAYWFDSKSGAMANSSKYGTTMSAWVKAFNDQRYADRHIGKPWQRLLPETQYAASTRDDYPYEGSMPGDGRQFPHVVSATRATESDTYYGNFAMTPMANQMVLDFAREAIEKEFLGQHSDSDMLILSMSAGEKLTETFGPYSQETQDLVLRLDQGLASFFQFIDSKIGLNKCLVIFTASHGSPAIPEFSQQRGLEAGRVNPKVLANFLDAKLDAQVAQEDWIESFQPPNLYFNLDAIDKHKLRQPDVESLVAKMSMSVPGIGEAITAWQLYTNQVPNNALADSVKRSYVFGRSGEVFIIPKPGYIFSEQANGTAYGSPYQYDSQVPLILCGAGAKPGRYSKAASLADIAPTIASVLEIEAPSLCEGRSLAEALPEVYGPPTPRVDSKEQASSPPPEEDSKKRRRR